MKKGWEVKKLGEICTIERGSSPRPIDNFITSDGSGYNWIKIGDTKNINKYLYSTKERITIEGTKKSRYVKKGDLILSNSMSYGKAFILQTDGFIHDGWFVLRLPENINTEFLFYAFSSPNVNEQIIKLSSGSVVKNISSDLVKKVDIPIPPLPEQKRIVEMLDKAFAEIDKAKANAEKNLKNAKELFDSYLNNIFENKGDGWEEKRLGEVCRLVRGPFGGSLKKNIFKTEGYAVFEQQHAIYDRFEDIRYFIDEKKFNEMKRFELNPGDLIMSCSGTMGKIAIVPNNIKRGIINQALLKITPSSKVFNHFLKMWIRSRDFQNSLREYAQGAAIQNVASIAILKDTVIPLPAVSIQLSIVNKLDAFSIETKKLEETYKKEIKNLEELKKSILEKAFKGDI